MTTLPRLDILLYAHDGRGLGHASRTIAVGMALRRLSPHLKVLFVTGCSFSQELIFTSPLDWLKLPSYDTEVTNGRSKGITGKSNFSDSELGQFRAQQLLQLIELYRPRLVLADHSPLGKHKELLPTLQYTEHKDTKWVLGIRGVVGQVGQIQSEFAASIFKKHYNSLIWYGDSSVLGNEQLLAIQDQYAADPVECGYVSRIKEVAALKHNFQETPTDGKIIGTISIPWLGEQTEALLEKLYKSLLKTTGNSGKWQLFLDDTHRRSNHFFSLFNSLPHCTVEKPGSGYLQSIMRSKCCIIYGGYNSLMDVLSLSRPSLIITRDMQDNEQQYHLAKLKQSAGSLLTVLPEDADEDSLDRALQSIMQKEQKKAAVNLDGAANSARYLISLLQ